jgi:hypothetical protein
MKSGKVEELEMDGRHLSDWTWLPLPATLRLGKFLKLDPLPFRPISILNFPIPPLSPPPIRLPVSPAIFFSRGLPVNLDSARYCFLPLTRRSRRWRASELEKELGSCGGSTRTAPTRPTPSTAAQHTAPSRRPLESRPSRLLRRLGGARR